MNIKLIKELAQIIKQNELSIVEIAEGESRIRIERVTHPAYLEGASESGVVVRTATRQGQKAATATAQEAEADFGDLTLVRSPLVGVYYAAPSPDAEPFVKIGSRVKKGDVLCIVEAMKLMNEITAEQDGEIVDICVANGDVVEFGQTLYMMD